MMIGNMISDVSPSSFYDVIAFAPKLTSLAQNENEAYQEGYDDGGGGDDGGGE